MSISNSERALLHTSLKTDRLASRFPIDGQAEIGERTFKVGDQAGLLLFTMATGIESASNCEINVLRRDADAFLFFFHSLSQDKVDCI